MNGPDELRSLLQDIGNGDRAATDRLFKELYPELRRLAQLHLARERPNHTLQPTALLNEVYVRFAGTPPVEWRDRVHFLAVASKVMRHVLVDHARGRGRAKRPGRHLHLPLEEALTASPGKDTLDLIAIDQALTRLEQDHPEKARVVVMRFFGGMTDEEIAAVLSVTPRTVRRYWAYAQARLYEDIAGQES